MTAEEIHKALADKFGEQVGPLLPARRDPFCIVKAEALLEIASFLKHDPALAFDSLMSVSAVEPFKGKTAMLVVYHLYSYAKRHAFVVKVELDRARPDVPSVE
ncbi:MAG TPA: NADH-quinone oxidoreductase subunit C, partial [Solirubrobacterales bacterium]|nr:NADH-quinone oxidoreductase subunit C [Solirubrobacterales bacterium]